LGDQNEFPKNASRCRPDTLTRSTILSSEMARNPPHVSYWTLHTGSSEHRADQTFAPAALR